MNTDEIRAKFDAIIDTLSNEFKSKWLQDITLEISEGGFTHVIRNGMTVYLSTDKLNIADADGAFREYKIVLDRINVDYHVLPKQGRYIITDDVTTWTLIHELAHIISFQMHTECIEPHGAEFCKVYDTLIYHIDPHIKWAFKR